MFNFRSFFVVVLVFSPLEFGFAEPMYKTVGGSAVLKPDQTSGPITSVTWKHQTDLALEWFGGEITYYRTFNDRCDLDKTNGRFTIRNLKLEDSGEYTPEINNIVLSKKELKVIKLVPKPTVSMDCNNEKTVCNLTCEANITSEFGPVTYKWKTGGTELSNDKKLSLTPKNEESSFFCMLINPVNNSTSDEFFNPFSNTFSGGINNAVVIILVVIGVLLLITVGLVIFVLWKRVPRVRTMWPFKYLPKNEDNPAPRKVEKDYVLEEGQNLLQEPQTTTENNSKGEEALNGDMHANTNKDVCVLLTGISKVTETSVSIEGQPTEQVINNKVEPGQNSRPEKPEPTADGPGKPKDSTCDPSVDTHPEPESDPSAVTPEPNSQTEALSGDLLANTNEDGKNKVSETSDSVEQQQDPPTEQVSDDEGESGQNSNSEEPEPTAEGPETSPPESNSEETPDTGPAES